MNISATASGSAPAAPSGGTRVIAQAAPTNSGGTDSAVSTPAPSIAKVAQAVKQVNDAFAQKGQNLYASIERDKVAGIDVVKIEDSVTHQVVAQYPSKAIVAMADAMAQQPQGGSGQLMNVSA